MTSLATDKAFETRTRGQNQCKDVLPISDPELTLKVGTAETAQEAKGTQEEI